MLKKDEYIDKKVEDFTYAESIVAAINNDPRPGVLYKESRELTDLKQLIASSVRLFGDNVAFYQKYKHDEPYTAITYYEMQERMNRVGTALIDMGFEGERVAVAGPNSSEWSISYLGVVNGVGVVVPLDKELNQNELEQQLIRAEVSCILYGSSALDKKFKAIVADGKTKVRQLIRFDIEEDDGDVLAWKKLCDRGEELLHKGDGRYIDAQIDATSMSILLFTSGTTGIAKGVMLSHRNIVVDLMISPTVLKVNPWDIFFSVLPLHHTYECTSGFLIPLYKGATIAYCEGLRYITKNMEEIKPTMFLGVPAIFEAIYKKIWKNVRKSGKEKALKKAIRANNLLKKVHIDLSSKLFKDVLAVFGGRMREMIVGGAAIDPNILQGLKDFGINALQGYGLTECAPMGCINPDQMTKNNSVGLPFPAMDLIIHGADEDGIGEVWIRGGNVMLGYYEDPEATAAVMEDGWLKTGDLGYLDKDGYLILTGRMKNVIITKNGKNVFPEELEYYLGLSDLVKESMVFEEENTDGDDTVIVASVVPDKEEVEEALGAEADAEAIYKALWAEVDKINNEQPFFKRIKKLVVRDRDFVKNTSNKIIRFHEDNKRA